MFRQYYFLHARSKNPQQPGGNTIIRKTADLKLPNGKVFRVKADNVSEKNIYIKSTQLNGKVLNRPYITYEEIEAGGVLEFDMTGEIPKHK